MTLAFRKGWLFLLANFMLAFCYSQDIIVKRSGDSISVKLLEIGLEAVSYKKTSMLNGPTYVLEKKEIFLIRYANGEVEHFTQAAPSQTAAVNSNTTSTASDKSESNNPEKNKIEFINDQFTINGQKAKRKDVNRYLSKSKNPAIVLGLKATKLTGTAQKIVKITSFPTTIIGSVTTLFTVVEGYQLVQRGRATGKTFVNMGLSFLGTISLPITNKILKKKSDKMYDKLIDMYNVTN
jgi:hypothetical protein